ncbi:MAG: bifunctional demethylmenaquinone methyltransferase/2-methoxy-6-polyprenyl-1,4-benzoquinol methylase UbiE [Bacteroidota bacterium]|nr:bifunctional demethylmenaquinone methyltransferase/2-methoxy-6-polyprenyl-1,4-benzoquinol methylase UbiE [Bacteroidota bacterium]
MNSTDKNKSSTVTPYGIKGQSKKEEVATMFNNIAARYDFLNHVLSMGIDKGWRRKAVAYFRDNPPAHLLDIATGTADFAISALKINPGKITGVDISEGMLEMGRKKIREKGLEDKIELVYGDSEQLPFPAHTFDAAMVAFGVRNFADLDKGLKDIHRVLRPGGKLVILEFSSPSAFPVKQLYWTYFRCVLPVIGRLISKDSAAYTYLPESVKAFPDGNLFLERLAGAGFHHTWQKQLTFGIASIYCGISK